VALRGRRIAVLSQQRRPDRTLRFGDWTIADEGKTYEFPRTKNGQISYRTLEGLCWLTDRSFVFVSDLSKLGYRKAWKTDQSIHVFTLPRGRAKKSGARHAQRDARR
jgi:hypothetical protein